MGWFLDRASSERQTFPTATERKCGACRRAVADDDLLAIDETYTFDRGAQRHVTRRHYLHLACAFEQDREILRTALQARDSANLGDALVDALAQLDQALAAEAQDLFRMRFGRVVDRVVTPLDDPRTLELLAQLEAAPDDRHLYAVLADHLQQLGDDRGELIALDLGAPPDLASFERRRELARKVSPELAPGVTATWSLGFFRTVELANVNTLHTHATLLAHPACRLLRVLRVHTTDTRHVLELSTVLPRSLRTLKIEAHLAPHPPLADLPYLERLELVGCTALHHPTVRALRLPHAPSAETLSACARGLPAVTTLEVTGVDTTVLAALAASGWLQRLDELALSSSPTGPALVRDDVALLERELANRRLARLSLHHSRLTADLRPRLQRLCEHLEFPDPLPAAPPTAWIEHTARPEWGRGKILREADGKIHVAFPSGTRTFVANAPFLRRIDEP